MNMSGAAPIDIEKFYTRMPTNIRLNNNRSALLGMGTG